MTKPEITFAIPFHARRDYLVETLASVTGQSVSSWEAVVCDNSEGGEGEPVVAATRDPRIRWVRTGPGVGIGANWNACLEAGSSDLVTLLHADDLALPGYAALMIGAAREDRQAAAFFCKARVIDEKGHPRRSFREWVKDRISPSTARRFPVEGEEGLASLAFGDFIMCPTLCYRRSALGERRFRTDLRSALDLELKSGLILDGRRLVGLPEVAYAYRRHGGSESELEKAGGGRFAEELDVLDAVAKEAEARGWRRAARVARAKPLVRLHVAVVALQRILVLDVAGASRGLALALAGRSPGRP